MSELPDGISLVDSSEWKDKNPSKENKKRKDKGLSRARLIIYGLILLVWIMLMKAASVSGFGQPFFILSAIMLMFLNLGKRKEGTLSAYSIFNKGSQRLLGTFNHEAIEEQFGGRRVEEEDERRNMKDNKEKKLQNTSLNKMSKMGNQECYCGSGKKFKKCCYWRELKAREDKFKPKPVNPMPDNFVSDSESD